MQCTKQVVPCLWRTDQFDTKYPDQEHAMAKHFSGAVSQSAHCDMLASVNQDKERSQQLLADIIDNMLIAIGNSCQLTTITHNCQQPLSSCRDLHLAIKAVERIENQYMLLHYILHYVRDALYLDTLGVTHQHAVEDAIKMLLNVQIAPRDAATSARYKSCIAKLYSEVYNNLKHCILGAVLPVTTTLLLEQGH